MMAVNALAILSGSLPKKTRFIGGNNHSYRPDTALLHHATQLDSLTTYSHDFVSHISTKKRGGVSVSVSAGRERKTSGTDDSPRNSGIA